MMALRTLAAMLWFAAWFFVAVPWLVLRGTGTDPAAAWRAAGPAELALLAALGVAVIGLVVFFVREGGGTPAPFDPPRRVVSRGPYRFTRNPMYLSYLAVVAAEAWLFRSTALLVYAGALFAVAHVYVAMLEEPALRQRFGDAYTTYCKGVRRWL